MVGDCSRDNKNEISVSFNAKIWSQNLCSNVAGWKVKVEERIFLIGALKMKTVERKRLSRVHRKPEDSSVLSVQNPDVNLGVCSKTELETQDI